MKKAILIIIPVLIVIVALITAAVIYKNGKDVETIKTMESSSTGSPTIGKGIGDNTSTAETTAPGSQTAQQDGTEQEPSAGEVMMRDEADLDGDGKAEKIEITRVFVKNEAGGMAENEGRLRITGNNGTSEKIFVKKPQESLTGLFTGVEYRDLDGDGVKDIFITIPDNGASFSLNYFYMYNHKSGLSFSSFIDNAIELNLGDFSTGFRFMYKGKGMLEVSNDAYGFKGTMDISDSGGILEDEEANKVYENSWIDPAPVEIREDLKLELLAEEGSPAVIKFPLPVFGQATVDLIGGMELYYRIDSGFKPVLYKFELYDLKGSEKVKAGECIIK